MISSLSKQQQFWKLPWVSALAAILTVLWVQQAIDDYQTGISSVNEDGSEKYYDEWSVLEDYGVALLIAEEAESLSVLERWLVGADDSEYIQREAINALGTAHKRDQLTESGISMLASLHWASGNKGKAELLAEELKDCEYSSSQTLVDLLAGKQLEDYQWKDLDDEVKTRPRDWVVSFLSNQACKSKPMPSGKGGELEGLVQLRRRALFTSNMRLSALTWVLFIGGVISAALLIRHHRLSCGERAMEAPKFPELWPLPLALIVFVLGEFLSDWVAIFLWSIKLPDVGVLSEWFSYIVYDSIYRSLGGIIMILVFFRPTRWASVRKTFFRPVPRLGYWVLGAFTLTCAFSMVVYVLPSDWFPVDPTIGYQWRVDGFLGLVLGLTSAVIFAPIFEELIFRGLLFNALKNKLGLHFAACVSAVMFTAVHFYGVEGMIGVAFFGLLMAYLYHYTGSLVPCILCHSLYNLTITCWDWLLTKSPEEWWTLTGS